jgi:hypothetical protein
MAVATLQANIANFPSGMDSAQRRFRVFGTCSIVGSSPSYVPGGIRLSFSPLELIKSVTMLPQWVDFDSLNNSGFLYEHAPLGFQIKTIALTSNVVTITANNALAAGDIVQLSGITTATFLNGAVLTVLAGSLSATVFTANFTHANYGSANDTGYVLPLTYASGTPYQGLVQIFTGAAAQAPLTELTVGALPTGVVGSATINPDVIGFRAEFLKAL